MQNRSLVLCAALLVAALSTGALAGKGPLYRYGEMWWGEYEADPQTELLLHFGPPQPPPRKLLAAAVEDRRKDEVLADAGELAPGRGTGVDSELTKGTGELGGKPPVDESRLPAGTVADYSEQRRNLRLEPGFELVPEGRFGAALKISKPGGLRSSVRNPQAAECWFRVDALPAAEACLLSLGDDEGRLLLRPDGCLELRLKKPHGNPNTKKLVPAAIEAIMSRDATIVAPTPITVKSWTHVAVYAVPHPAPNNTSPFEAQLRVDGTVVANYLSEGGNLYDFLGDRQSRVVLGDSAAGGQPFTGLLDEVRVSSAFRDYYERVAFPWRDATAVRPVQFNTPFFRADSTVFHASLDKGTTLDLNSAGAGAIQVNLRGEKLDGMLVDGIRGKGWLMDPDIGFARFPLAGMSAKAGALEFWLRPVNWDDVTGYWNHSPPAQLHLSVVRLYAKDAAGKEKLALNITLPRAFDLERARIPLDPGHWLHVVALWNAEQTDRGWVFIDGKFHGRVWRAKPEELAGAELSWAEFGVSDKVQVMRREPPLIEIDEVVGYRQPLRKDEVVQAHQRWMAKLEPIPLYNAAYHFKYSLQKLEFEVTPLLPDGVTPAACTVALHDLKRDGAVCLGPVTVNTLDKEAFRFLLNDGKTFPFGSYQFRFKITDPAGKAVVEATQDWTYAEDPWRHCTAGILDQVPAPWTPIKASAEQLETRMTKYVFGADGLPREIYADGVNVLQAPLQFLEDGKPLRGTVTTPMAGTGLEATWAATFTGTTCDILMQCRAEYDGMIRYELALKPKGKVGTIAFVMPVKAANASRWLAYPVGARGPRTGEVPAKDGLVLTSRADPASYQTWRAYCDEAKKDPKLKWEDYWRPIRESTQAYGFYTHADLNDMNRGLWWFCDNAAGWAQSKTLGAVEIRRQADTVSLVLNLVAEPGEYKPGKPIVFAILPHPARPMPDKYRLFNKGNDADPRVGDVYDAFFPWAKPPRGGGSLVMTMFPATDPKNPKAGPSWEYAESCIPLMKAVKPQGLRTMYLSKAWFSCRAGQYDGWEWRSGETGTVSLTPGFVNYLCWEMNEWIKRDIWDAIYLDECYEHPARNLEAGHSVLLPDGSEQPGVTNFQFRELMKRWRNIFTQHGKEPFLISHLTYSWQYPGVVFCDSYLDGENRPIVSLNSPDWIDSTGKAQFEVVQNSRLWGVSSFYMPFIAEGGFENKTKSTFPRWQWRMARQAQSQFAHYETETVYEGQGGEVYKAYWNDLLSWGGGDAKAVTFHPYWDNAKFVKVDGQGADTLVSFYRAKDRVFLIASNRRKTEADLRITLDLKALGLADTPTIKVRDGSFEPPPGDDFTGAATGTAQAAASFEKPLQLNPDKAGTDIMDKSDDELLNDPDAVKAAKAGEWAPKLGAGGVLSLRVRPRDYRVITLQP